MLLVADKPPHPVAKKINTGIATSDETLQFNLTEPQYKVAYAIRNI